MTRLLLVDDERNVLNALMRICSDAAAPPSLGKVRVAMFESPYGAMEFARSHPVDAVISDYRMPEMNGATMLTHMRSIQPDAARIILSATADRDAVIRSINDAAIFRFLSKPWNAIELKQTIVEAIAASRRGIEDRRLADEMRARQCALTPQELALRRLQEESPEIAHVELSEDGGVLLVS